MFNFLKKHIVADESIKSNQTPIFYPLPKEEIAEAEDLLKMQFPKELKRFYEEIGYGFLKTNKTLINRFMDPFSVADFRLRQDIYEYNPNLDDVDDDDESLVFFEVTELNFLTIKFKEENELGQCPIYSEDEKIADSLEEFLIKMEGNPDYYI
ncbi:SMI1/KNR4 family protein [Bacillus mobilis]|uniref:SMI1/KNR4 family protein n=1 Tax=Bacillus mobilis TaxID=2026190 RepID=UPI0035E1BB87